MKKDRKCTHTLDARGLNCPLPILHTRKAMKGMNPGEVLEVTATDPGSVKDMASFCSQTGAEVKLVACQMTVDLFDYGKDDFIPEIEEWVGAASFLPRALNADVNLFV